MVQSKYHLGSEPDLPFAAASRSSAGQIQRGGDNPECRGVGHISARVIKMGRIGHAKHLHPELKLHPLGDIEVPENAAIQVEETRSPDDVATSSTKAYLRSRDGAECGRVEVVT